MESSEIEIDPEVVASSDFRVAVQRWLTERFDHAPTEAQIDAKVDQMERAAALIMIRSPQIDRFERRQMVLKEALPDEV